MKKIWIYQCKNDKRPATLTTLRSMIKEYDNDAIYLKLEKLDTNWFIEWEAFINIEDVRNDSEIGEYPFVCKIPKHIQSQITKANKPKDRKQSTQQ